MSSDADKAFYYETTILPPEAENYLDWVDTLVDELVDMVKEARGSGGIHYLPFSERVIAESVVNKVASEIRAHARAAATMAMVA